MRSSPDKILASNAFIKVLDSAAVSQPKQGKLRVAIKANIDLAGHITSSGSKLLAEEGTSALSDAGCLDGFRRAGAIIVGICNMNQLAFGSYGNNADFGDVANPLDDRLISGGSSSGSTAAVANRWADIALGTDTGGSIRIPAACQGVAGLKTTFGLISTRGVQPLAESFDTIGPIARDVSGLETGMLLLHSEFTPDTGGGLTTIGRLRINGVHNSQNHAVDTALRQADLDDLIDIENTLTEGWDEAVEFTSAIMRGEMFRTYSKYDEGNDSSPSYPRFDAKIGAALRTGQLFDADRAQRQTAYRFKNRWAVELGHLLDDHGVVALPALNQPVPTWEEIRFNPVKISHLVNPINAAGLPAVTIPIGSTSALPVGIQLIGRANNEATLL
ncbi:amidase, partial [Nocardia salmonicida]